MVDDETGKTCCALQYIVSVAREGGRRKQKSGSATQRWPLAYPFTTDSDGRLVGR